MVYSHPRMERLIMGIQVPTTGYWLIDEYPLWWEFVYQNVLTKKTTDRFNEEISPLWNFLVLKPTSSLEMGHGVSSLLGK